MMKRRLFANLTLFFAPKIFERVLAGMLLQAAPFFFFAREDGI